MPYDIRFVRQELLDCQERYTRIRDCVSQTVKQKGAKYLPQPNPTETADWNVARYAAYLERAIFYDVTARTLAAMVTQVFARDPLIELPKPLESLRNDATGRGLSLVQLAKDCVRDTVGWGRGGLYVDMETDAKGITAQELEDGTKGPVFTIYDSDSIINWEEQRRFRRTVKTLIVLRETYDVRDGFGITQKPQYRELGLDENSEYYIQLWRETNDPSPTVSFDQPGVIPKPAGLTDPTNSVTPFGVRVYPLDANGKRWKEIPFEFIGAVNNDSTIDEPPMYGMAELNIGHYRNSADYEEATFLIGQPTPWFSGLTEEWVEDVFENKPILLGSRNAVLLPENSLAGLLQVADNSMPMEGMKHKEAQMVALGAKLVENRAVRRTLGEVQQASASETSILAACATNVSTAFTRGEVWALKFVSKTVDPNTCKFVLNTDFALTELAADERAALINEYQGGLLTFEEVRERYRRGGLATLDDAEAKTAIEAEVAAKDERETQKAVKLAAAKPAPAKPASK